MHRRAAQQRQQHGLERGVRPAAAVRHERGSREWREAEQHRLRQRESAMGTLLRLTAALVAALAATGIATAAASVTTPVTTSAATSAATSIFATERCAESAARAR